MKRLHKDYMRSNEGYASWHKDPRHQWVHWFLLLIVVFGSIFAFTQVFKDYEVAGTADSNVSALYKAYITNSQVKNIKKDTSTLLSLRGERVAADTSGRASIEQDMKKVAERRKNVMLTLIRNGQADRVIDTAISDADRNNLPAEVQAFVEKRETKTGTYVWTHADYFDSGTAENEYKVVTPARSYTVHYTNANRIPSVTTGDDVSVDGLVFGDEAVVVNTDANTQAVVADTTVADGATTPTTTKRLAIMLVNFQDNTTQPFTTAQVQSTYFTATDSIKKYFEEGSFGQWTLEGDVFGYYTLPMNQVAAGGCTGSTYMYSLSAAADAAATAAGVNLSTYTNKVYIFPKQTNCGWSGLGQMGAGKSWINVISTTQMSGTGAHELGHNFNLHHASSFNCTNSAGTRVTLYGGICTSTGSNEYGDPYDIMGKSTHRMHFNGFHKGVTANNGPQWLSSTNIVTLNPTTTGGTYTIKPLGQPTTQTQVIRVPVPNYGYYYFEFRQQSGVFENYTGALIPGATGVLVHVAGEFTSTAQSKLLDMTPTTTSFYDAALLPGQSYSDPNVPMTVTVNSISPTGANVTFAFSGGASACTHFNPGVSVGTAQNTNTPSTKSYNVTITNFDSSNCAASPFNYTATLPSGWTKSPESFTDIIAPGQSLTKTFLVTYPSTVTPGYNNLTFTGANAATGLSNFVGSQTVQQLVEISGTPPQVTLTSPLQGAVISGDVTLSAGLEDAPGSNTQTKLYIDDVLKQTCTGFVCSVVVPAAQITNGSHVAKATSTNTTTGISTQDIADFTKTGTTTTTAPAITLTSPVEGDSVAGDVVISSTLAAGSVPINVDSKLYLDNILKQTCNGTMTCSITIPAAQVATGAHTAAATAVYTPNSSTTNDSNAFTKTTATPPISAPAISIPIPVNNATYTDELVITTALSTTTPTGVQTKIYVDGSLKKTCNDTVSCLVALLSSETTLGVHTISATATYIPNGSSTNASKTVTKVQVTPPPITAPQVTLSSPSEGSVQNNDVSISAGFPAGATVANVETKLYLDGVLKNTCTSVTTCAIVIPAAQIAIGTHTASATATHTPTGTTTNDSNTFTKASTPPPTGGVQIQALTPTEGSIQNGVIQLSAALPIGTPGTNMELKLFIDNVLKKTCAGTPICYSSIIPYTIATGAHTFTATATNTTNGQTSTDSHSFTKTSSTPPPLPPASGATVGSNPNMVTIVSPIDGATVTGGFSVTATTTPEALALGRKIVLKMSTSNSNVSYQLGTPCNVSPCTITVAADNPYLTPGTHTISAQLMTMNPTWISQIATVTITKQ